jgi:amino acid adenylation domain-containing protein
VSPAIETPLGSTFDDLLERSNLTGRQFLVYAGQRLHPGLVLYDAVYTVRWPQLDPQRFAEAWQSLFDASDALRTVIEEIDGVPQQRVLPSRPIDLECVDLRDAPLPERALEEWIERRLQRPIVLEESLVDTALVRTTANDIVWYLNIHHVVADAAAVEMLMRRVAEQYDAGPGAAVDLPPYAVHVARECEARRSRAYRIDRDYWLARIARGTDMQRPYGAAASPTLRQHRAVLQIDVDSTAAVAATARLSQSQSIQSHAAASNLFLAALAMYLHRVGGGRRIAIGATFHNRRSEVDRATMGLFMEILPLILDVGPCDCLGSIARQAETVASEALTHRRYSVPNSARAPAYGTLFNYMQPLASPLDGVEVRRIHPGHGTHPISLSVAPPAKDRGYELWFDVDSAVAAGLPQRAATHFRTLFAAALREPHRSVETLPLLPPDEARTIVAACCGPVLPQAPGHGGCHEAFEKQAARAPDAVAVIAGELRMSYAELNWSADFLARRLRVLGARRGRRIGICLERSVQMLVAVLGVLKSGAAYVPLDPGYPAARLRVMLDDATPSVLVTSSTLAATLPAHAARVLELNNDGMAGDRDSGTDEGGPFIADDIAYVMYTSGSTGTPKGVLVTHGGVSNYLAWRESYFPLGPGDRCLQKASLSFDDSVWEILEPLCTGACVVLARPRFESDPAYLVDLIATQRITAACFVPSQLRMIVNEPASLSCTSLRRLTTGGETLSVALQRRVREVFPAAGLYNGYGTTETTIASAFWKCTDDPGQVSVPIGYPIANTRVVVLDSERQPLPHGVEGEIHIGGAGVALGYLNRPELTLERFIDDPFGPLTGLSAARNRMYRTGDRGRQRLDGALEFIGRGDEQVKIRGVRIELGEIEAALVDHPAVSAAAVTCVDSPAGEKRLIAYVVPRGIEAPSASDLREHLRDRLPPSMVPHRFEAIAALPMTPSGKLDRRALPEVPEVPDERTAYVAPRDDLETRLVALWQEVLEARPIGVRDDFFDLGGHSITAAQVAAAIERAFGRPMPAALLFDAPTIELLARRLARTVAAKPAGPLVLLREGGPGSALFLVHQIDGDVARYRDLAQRIRGPRAIYGLRAPGLEDEGQTPDSIEVIAAQYVEALRCAQRFGPYAIAGHSAGGLIALEMAQRLLEVGERVDVLALLDADARMRMRRGALDAIRFHAEAIGELPRSQRGTYLRDNLPRWLASAWRSEDPATPTTTEHNPVRSALERAVRAYQPKVYAGTMIVFRAMDRRITGTYSRNLGWRKLARGGLSVVDVPGNHLTMLRGSAVIPLAAALGDCLEASDGREVEG